MLVSPYQPFFRSKPSLRTSKQQLQVDSMKLLSPTKPRRRNSFDAVYPLLIPSLSAVIRLSQHLTLEALADLQSRKMLHSCLATLVQKYLKPLMTDSRHLLGPKDPSVYRWPDLSKKSGNDAGSRLSNWLSSSDCFLLIGAQPLLAGERSVSFWAWRSDRRRYGFRIGNDTGKLWLSLTRMVSADGRKQKCMTRIEDPEA